MVIALLAAAPMALLSDAELDARLARPAPLTTRIELFSALFLDTRYVEHPLGDGDAGPERGPLWRTDAVDCVTFVETVLALAGSESLARARRTLDELRYGREPRSFAVRNHFVEAQWIPANVSRGYVRDAVPGLMPDAPAAVLELRRARWAKVPRLRRLAGAEVPDGDFPVRYVPAARMKGLASRIETGTIVLVVHESDPRRVVRTSHMGFVVGSGRDRKVRHASSLAHRVVDEPFEAFLRRCAARRDWKVIGFGLLQPLEPERTRHAGVPVR